MRRALYLIIALWAGLLPLLPSYAVDPDIRLDDPALERRALEITRQLRCPTCVSQSVDGSNVGISKDLQRLVRERIVAGDSDEQIFDYIASRYGDFVLLKPRFGGSNTLLWGFPIFLVSIAIVFWFVVLRRRSRTKTEQSRLSAKEQARLNELLGQSHRENIDTPRDANQ